MQTGQAFAVVAGEDRDGFDAQVLAGLPGGHQQQDAVVIVRAAWDGVVVAQWHLAAINEHALQSGQKGGEGKVLLGAGLRDDLHAGYEGASQKGSAEIVGA